MPDILAGKARRPTAITVICAIGFFGLAAFLWLAASGQFEGLPQWYTTFVFASAAVGLLAMTGMWLMRKWGYFLYVGMFLVGQVVMVAAGLWLVTSIIAPLVVIVVGFMHLDQMR